MGIQIRWAKEEDGISVSEIRRKAFAVSDYEIENPILLHWGPSDRNNRVLLLTVDNQPVATARLDLTRSLEDVEFKLQCHRSLLPGEEGQTFGLFCRGAVLPDFQHKGIYRHLHRAGLQYFKESSVDHVVRSLIFDPKVCQSLQELGFEHSLTRQKWADFMATSKDPCIAWLQGSNLDHAIEILSRKCEDLFSITSHDPGFPGKELN